MNLGELYIKISVDDSPIDNLSKSFDEALKHAESLDRGIQNINKQLQSIETSMVAEIATGFANVGNSGNQATNSTNSFTDSLTNAIVKGELFADVMKGAFNAVVDLAGNAANAIGGLFQDIIGEYAAYEQNMDAMNTTFGQYANDFKQWMSDNAETLGMTMNEMLEHANKTGIILQKDNAQRRAEEAAGEQQSTEQQKQELSNRLSNLRAHLSNQLAETREAQAAEYDSWREYYANVLSELKENLQNEYDELKKSLDARVSARQKANEKELSDRTQALEDSYQNYKDSLDKELDELRDRLDQRVEFQRKANETELNERQRTLDDALDATKRALDAEVNAFNAATNARIKEINREYTERYKLIDEEKYAQLKAIQDRIDAIDAEREATKRGKEDSKNEAKLAELNEQFVAARRKSTKAKLQKQIDELELSMRETQHDRELVDEKSALKKEMDVVRDHFDDMKSELKEQQSEEVSQYKDTRANELAALKQSNADKLKEAKRHNQDELQELKNSQKNRLEQIKNENEQTLAQARSKNERLLKERKRANQNELQALRDRQKAEIDAMREENSNILAEKKRANDQAIKEQSDFNSQQLKNLKSAQAAELREIQEHNRQLLQEQQNYINEQKKLIGSSSGTYAAPDDEDRRQSMETLKSLMQTAAEVGAARNMTTDEVLSIFEAMNYGRFATFDNTGLGYANKTGIQQMVADMSARLNKPLDPENFNDVAEALKELINVYQMSGKAAYESVHTISGSFNALRASWSKFKLAIATEGTEDDDAVLNKLFYGTGENGDEGTVTNFLNNLIPVVGRIIEGISHFIKERAPEIFSKLWDTVVSALPPEWSEELRKLGDSIQGLVDQLSRMFPSVSDFINGITDILKKFNDLTDTANAITGEQGLGGIARIIGDIGFALAALWTVGKIESAINLLKGLGDVVGNVGGKLGGLGPSGSAAAKGVEEVGEAAGKAVGGEAAGGAAAGAGGAAASKAAGGGILGKLGAAVGEVGSAFMGIPAAALVGSVAIGNLMYQHEQETHAVKKFAEAHDGYANATQVNARATADVIAEKARKVISGQENMGDSADDLKEKYKNLSEENKRWVDDFAENAKKRSEETGNWTKGIEGFFNSLTETTTTSSGTMKSKLLTDLNEIDESSKVNTASMGSGWNTAMDGIQTKTSDTAQNVRVQTSGMLTDMKTQFDGSSETLVDPGKAIIEGFGRGLEEAWTNIKNFFTGIIPWIQQNKGPIESDREALVEAGKSIMLGFKDGIDIEWPNVQQFFSSVQSNIGSFFNGAGGWLTEKGNGIINGLKGGIDSVWPNVQSFFGGVNQNIQNHFSGSYGWLNGDGNDIINGMQNGIDNAWNAVQSFFGGVNGEILQNFFNSDWWLNGDGHNIINGLNDGLNDAYSAIDNFFGNIPSSIGNMFYDAGDWLVSNGQNIMIGLYNGLVDVWNNTVAPFISGMGDWMHMNDGPEQQDKKVLFKNGQWFMEGLDEGLQSRFPLIQKSIDEVVGMMDVGSTITSNYENNVSKGKQRFINVNIDNMSVRNDQDIYEVAYQLDNIWSREMMGAL